MDLSEFEHELYSLLSNLISDFTYSDWAIVIGSLIGLAAFLIGFLGTLSYLSARKKAKPVCTASQCEVCNRHFQSLITMNTNTLNTLDRSFEMIEKIHKDAITTIKESHSETLELVGRLLHKENLDCQKLE
jgi:hypothetical protein